MRVKRLEGKIALVTGGSSGIGRASALVFVREGAKVVIADVNVKGGEETLRMIKEAGGEAIFVRTDVSEASQVEALVKKAVDTYGRLDCAFNNAGVEPAQGMGALADCPEEEWDRVININLKGVWLCMKYEIPQMLKQGGGAIVNTSSVAGLIGGGLSAYVASKHGIVGLTKTGALDYAGAGIRVNAICPGGARTPMLDSLISGNPEIEAAICQVHPIGRFAEPAEIAEAAAWLCSNEASFVTGIAMPVDGGLVAR